MGRLDRSPRANWVERKGGLPDYIDRIAVHLHEKGMPISQAIAVAINAVKRACATGDLNFPGMQNENAGSRAEACKAVAQWEALKAAHTGEQAATPSRPGAHPVLLLAWNVGPDRLELARHVRTEAGVRRYHKPIGALISGGAADPLTHLTVTDGKKRAVLRRNRDGSVERKVGGNWRAATDNERTLLAAAEKRHAADADRIKAGGSPKRGADYVAEAKAKPKRTPARAPKADAVPDPAPKAKPAAAPKPAETFKGKPVPEGMRVNNGHLVNPDPKAIYRRYTSNKASADHAENDYTRDEMTAAMREADRRGDRHTERQIRQSMERRFGRPERTPTGPSENPVLPDGRAAPTFNPAWTPAQRQQWVDAQHREIDRERATNAKPKSSPVPAAHEALAQRMHAAAGGQKQGSSAQHVLLGSARLARGEKPEKVAADVPEPVRADVAKGYEQGAAGLRKGGHGEIADRLDATAAHLRGDSSTPAAGKRAPDAAASERGRRGGLAAAGARRAREGRGSAADLDDAEDRAARRGPAREATYTDSRQELLREARELGANPSAAQLAKFDGRDAGQIVQLNRARAELGLRPVLADRETVKTRKRSGSDVAIRDEVAGARSGPARNKVLGELSDADLEQVASVEARENQLRGSGRGGGSFDRRKQAAYEKRERIIRDVRAEQGRRKGNQQPAADHASAPAPSAAAVARAKAKLAERQQAERDAEARVKATAQRHAEETAKAKQNAKAEAERVAANPTPVPAAKGYEQPHRALFDAPDFKPNGNSGQDQVIAMQKAVKTGRSVFFDPATSAYGTTKPSGRYIEFRPDGSSLIRGADGGSQVASPERTRRTVDDALRRVRVGADSKLKRGGVTAGRRTQEVEAARAAAKRKTRAKSGAVSAANSRSRTVDYVALAGVFDPAKHPRAPKGSANGGQFGPARNAQAAQAQKDPKAKANYGKTLDAKDADAQLKAMNDADLQALSKAAYSFKSSDPKVVALRIKIANQLASRGMDVKNFGALGGGAAKPATKKVASGSSVAKAGATAAKKVKAAHSTAEPLALAGPHHYRHGWIKLDGLSDNTPTSAGTTPAQYAARGKTLTKAHREALSGALHTPGNALPRHVVGRDIHRDLTARGYATTGQGARLTHHGRAAAEAVAAGKKIPDVSEPAAKKNARTKASMSATVNKLDSAAADTLAKHFGVTRQQAAKRAQSMSDDDFDALPAGVRKAANRLSILGAKETAALSHGLALSTPSVTSGDGPQVTLNAGARRGMAKSGVAMRDGSFPIPDRKHLHKAIKAVGRAHPSKRSAVRAHIRKRAKALGVPVPDGAKGKS